VIGARVGQLFGIEIRASFGWVLILGVIAFLAVSELQFVHPDLADAPAWVLGALVAVAFFLSSAAHDLAHAVVARRRGVAVPSVAVSFFGGSTPNDPVATSAGDDLAIGAAGPLTSVAIAGVLGAVTVALGSISGPVWNLASSVVGVVAVLNFILGIVNFLPAFPLDGGRLVRAVGWRRRGSIEAGWSAAATVGRLIGLAIIGIGIAIVLGGLVTNGAMTAVSGWFLVMSARSISERLRVDRLIGGFRVSDAMETSPVSVAPHLTVDTLAGELLDDGSVTSAVPVVSDGDVVGVLGQREIRKLRRALWPTTRVEDIMVRPPRLPMVSVGDSLVTAVERLYRAGLDGMPVLEQGSLAGMLTRRSVGRLVHERTVLMGGGRTAR
jgi:Zn-dependent protease/predicted transcriptional regulator